MKKKFKLFTTIASLCLAIALMGFGVYAATQVTVTVTNTVSYTASANVKAEVRYAKAYTNAGNTARTKPTDADIAIEASETEATKTLALGDDTLTVTDATQNVTYTYTIYIKNTAEATDQFKVLNVTVTEPAATATLADDGYVVTFTNNITGNKIAQGAESSYEVKIEVDASRSIADIDLGSSFVLTMTEA